MDVAIAELLAILALGGITHVVPSIGATTVVHSQPALWVATTVTRRTVLVSTAWPVLLGGRSGTLGGPVAIIQQTPPPPPPPPAIPPPQP
ncbi:MAG: hypothetical protein JRI23_00075 [Deltaproteobacteria bacterium]|jgi:hypothetical protein|nr:hypothetical protein [Deltaproteobacteria bacterium]MBW2529839.1 hypothetical protein [Deltaproteobacteria bacterium]